MALHTVNLFVPSNVYSDSKWDVYTGRNIFTSLTLLNNNKHLTYLNIAQNICPRFYSNPQGGCHEHIFFSFNSMRALFTVLRIFLAIFAGSPCSKYMYGGFFILFFEYFNDFSYKGSISGIVLIQSWTHRSAVHHKGGRCAAVWLGGCWPPLGQCRP